VTVAGLSRELAGAALDRTAAHWPTGRRRSITAGVLVAAVVVFGSLDAQQHYDLVGLPALAIGVLVALPVALCWNQPATAYWLSLAVSATVPLAETPVSSAETWPWSVTVLLAHVVVLVVVGRLMRRDLRPAGAAGRYAAIWLLGLLAGAVPLLVHPQRGGGLLGLVPSAVVTGAAAWAAAMVRQRRIDADRLAAEQETTAAERTHRGLLEERARIARELHDVVAHHMSVIAIRADSAPYRIEGLGEPTREELTEIADTARSGLTEMRRLLTVLRDGEDGRTAPQPGLAELPALAERVRGAGLPVDLTIVPIPGPRLPEGAELAAYRIVQEALSNALRHAPGSLATVTVRPEASALRIVVENSAPDGPGGPPGSGRGLVGMRERAAVWDGGVQAGPTSDGGFRVCAVLPVSPVRSGRHRSAAQ
jgi:signal transduction histidine kinase